MDPSRKRAIRLTVALTAAVLLATALIYVSFNSGRKEFTATQLLHQAKPGGQYVLAGTVETGTIRRVGGTTYFRVLNPQGNVSVPVTYTGIVPDPFAAGRGVMLNVTDQGGKFIGQENSLTTKCPSKYQAASGSLKN